ncbi:DUF4430 domain-containing protein [Paenibacillus glycinis]|uniref:DUF4430 domain-containing protein n=1 Tax=Paenibacillus glycinis TaxID=2697035 RepID=UPI001F465BC6|nr:DUF4430 domain-containing protein [Paenibacillus glycinis]
MKITFKKRLAALGIAAALALAYFWGGSGHGGAPKPAGSSSGISVVREPVSNSSETASGANAEADPAGGTGQNEGGGQDASGAPSAEAAADESSVGQPSRDAAATAGSAVDVDAAAEPGSKPGGETAPKPGGQAAGGTTANPGGQAAAGSGGDAAAKPGKAGAVKPPAASQAHPGSPSGESSAAATPQQPPASAPQQPAADSNGNGAAAGKPSKTAEGTASGDQAETGGRTDASGGKKDQYQTDPVPAGKPKPVEWQDVEVDKKKVLTATLSVSCKTILDNLDQLDKDKLEVLPADGVIYRSQKVSFYEGESVFDVLLREMKKNKIQMEFEMTPLYNSNYIEGIHNLYEFDCGELSGWMYKVNGWFPNYGSSRYLLKDGDVVDWVYTCDLGRDVGDNQAAGGSDK